MLTDLIKKIKTLFKEHGRDLSLALLVFLTSVASFGLGRLSAIWPEKEPVRIDQPNKVDTSSAKGGLDETAAVSDFTKRSDPSTSPISSSHGNFVASKNGSSYHLPTCPGAKQIKEENKIWFKTAEEARRAGYKPAGNCQGL